MRKQTIFVVVLLAVVLLAACGPKAAGTSPAEPFMGEPAAEAPMLGAPAEKGESGGMPMPAPLPTAMAAAADAASGTTSSSETLDIAAASAPRTNRKIIKNAEIKLMVADTDVAIDRTTQVVGDIGAYIISSRIWYQSYYWKNYKYAVITMGVPVDQFETALRRLRALSVQVLDETASGQDVTDQYVDLQSQLGNLEATRDRIRTFLEQATTVEESLRVNQELSEIERQIEEIQGRMNYLSDRSAYSTITVNLEPELPEIMTPTPTPTATPKPWDPNRTFDSARRTVTSAYQSIFDLAIWFFVVVLPIFGPPVLLLWVIWRLIDRRTRRPSAGEEKEE